MQPDRPLRVGIALDAGAVRRWHATAVSEIERLGFCRVTVFVCEPGRSTIRRRLRRAARHPLYEGYLLADRRLFGGDDDALARVPIEGCGSEGTRRIRLAVGWSSAPTVATQGGGPGCAAVPRADVPAGRLAGCARFGAWSLHADGLRGPDAIWSHPSPCGHTHRWTASAPSIARSSGPTGSPCTAAAAGPPAGRLTWLPGGFATCSATGGPSSARSASTPSGIRPRGRIHCLPPTG